MLKFLTIFLSLTFLVSGCSEKTKSTPIVEEPLFCDLVIERFKYTQEEWDLRARKYPANLRREIQINKHLDRECMEDEIDPHT